jgi:hypothetical protein
MASSARHTSPVFPPLSLLAASIATEEAGSGRPAPAQEAGGGGGAPEPRGWDCGNAAREDEARQPAAGAEVEAGRSLGDERTLTFLSPAQVETSCVTGIRPCGPIFLHVCAELSPFWTCLCPVAAYTVLRSACARSTIIHVRSRRSRLRRLYGPAAMGLARLQCAVHTRRAIRSRSILVPCPWGRSCMPSSASVRDHTFSRSSSPNDPGYPTQRSSCLLRRSSGPGPAMGPEAGAPPFSGDGSTGWVRWVVAYPKIRNTRLVL